MQQLGIPRLDPQGCGHHGDTAVEAIQRDVAANVARGVGRWLDGDDVCARVLERCGDGEVTVMGTDVDDGRDGGDRRRIRKVHVAVFTRHGVGNFLVERVGRDAKLEPVGRAVLMTIGNRRKPGTRLRTWRRRMWSKPIRPRTRRCFGSRPYHRFAARRTGRCIDRPYPSGALGRGAAMGPLQRAEADRGLHERVGRSQCGQGSAAGDGSVLDDDHSITVSKGRETMSDDDDARLMTKLFDELHDDVFRFG